MHYFLLVSKNIQFDKQKPMLPTWIMTLLDAMIVFLFLWAGILVDNWECLRQPFNVKLMHHCLCNSYAVEDVYGISATKYSSTPLEPLFGTG
jgi:hypothetical protein